MNLRPFQDADVVELLEAFYDFKRVLYVCPTGGGKTVVCAALVLAFYEEGESVLFLAHRRELVDQARERFIEGGIPAEEIGVIMSGDGRFNPSAHVQIASVDTYRGRERFRRFDRVIIDEAHRAKAFGYQRILGRHPSAHVLGLTATPYRLNGDGMVGTFDTIVVGPSYSKLIGEGFLSAPLVYTVSEDNLPDLERVKSTGGDYNQKELALATNRQNLVGSIVEHWVQLAEGRRTVLFAVDIAHSQMMREEFSRAGVPAEHIDAKTEKYARAWALARLERGEVKVVTNCGIMTEGLDIPSLKCAVLARPTMSLGLHMQMSGRIFRPWEGKVPLILDHAGNTLRHGMPHQDRKWSIYGHKKGTTPGKIPVKTCEACHQIVFSDTRVCICGFLFWEQLRSYSLPLCRSGDPARSGTSPPDEGSVPHSTAIRSAEAPRVLGELLS